LLNRVVLVGRLTKDPDLRYTPNGVAVANFTLAVNRPFKNDGEQQADFINCVVWRRPAENLANFMGKGSLVGVDGRVQTRSFDNQEGKKVYVTEIVADSVQFLETKGSQSGTQGNDRSNNNSSQSSNSGYDQDPFKDKGDPIDIADDDLPF
jgi:single-strand DNA-binding protein